MFVLEVILTVLFAAALAFFGYSAVIGNPQTTAAMEKVGVPANYTKIIGGVEIAAALGLLLGLHFAGLGILTAICLIIFFAVAVFAHIRVKDQANMMTPAIFAVVALIILVLRIATKS